MADATNPPGFWVNQVSGPKGIFGRANQKGWLETTKDNIAGEWNRGNKGKAFGRVAATGVGLAMAAHAFKSVDAEGNDRSALVRLGEGVLGLGIAAAGLAGGRVR